MADISDNIVLRGADSPPSRPGLAHRPAQAVACTHHYILPPTGLIVVGVCKFCGAEKEHVNMVAETTMGGTATTAMLASRAAGAANMRRKANQRPIVLEKPDRRKVYD